MGDEHQFQRLLLRYEGKTMSKSKKRLTINDIAKLAGVSPTAVSFVINGRDGVSMSTRDKVNAVIKATGFHPNASSRRLSFQKSFNIALVYPSSASPFSDLYYYEIARGLTEKMSEEDYNVVFARLDAREGSYSLPKILQHRDADGAILLQDIDSAILADIDSLEIPYVLIDIHTPDHVHTHVSVDSEKSIYTATKHLINHGHEKIAFLGSDWLPSYYLQCLTGYQKALEEDNLPIQPAWLQKGANNKQDTETCINSILSCRTIPTAICCMGDIHAIDAINAVKAKGMSVPNDISFVSIDDILLSRYIEPPLTTVSYDKQRMGQIAAELLIKKIADEVVDSVIVDSDMIIERQSVKTLIK